MANSFAVYVTHHGRDGFQKNRTERVLGRREEIRKLLTFNVVLRVRTMHAEEHDRSGRVATAALIRMTASRTSWASTSGADRVGHLERPMPGRIADQRVG
jgi:hypothetical protein